MSYAVLTGQVGSTLTTSRWFRLGIAVELESIIDNDRPLKASKGWHAYPRSGALRMACIGKHAESIASSLACKDRMIRG